MLPPGKRCRAFRHLAVLAVLLAEYVPEPVDLLKVMKMVLLHDVVEIDAGDVFCYDPEAAVGKEEREIKAAERIYGLLPADQGRELRELWEEFEARSTPEAKFAACLRSPPAPPAQLPHRRRHLAHPRRTRG